MQGTISKAGTIKLGLALGADTRESVKRVFYTACAALFHGKDGKDLSTAAEELSTAGVSKKLGIPQSEVKDLPATVRQSAFPSGATIARFVGYVRRFPDALPDVSLEVYATAAASELRQAKALNPDKDADKAAVDKDATVLVQAAVDENAGEPISIRAARDAWQDGAKSTRTVKTDSPDTVGERVSWLIGQPAALIAFVADETNKAQLALLVEVATNILNGGNGITATTDEAVA